MNIQPLSPLFNLFEYSIDYKIWYMIFIEILNVYSSYNLNS